MSSCGMFLLSLFMKIGCHNGVGRYPVLDTWIPDRVRNDVRHFHAVLCPIQGMTVYMKMRLLFIPPPPRGRQGGGDFHPSLSPFQGMTVSG